ncbi:hypothetical protein PCE1_004569 [Barthelona sp. PCE]
MPAVVALDNHEWEDDVLIDVLEISEPTTDYLFGILEIIGNPDLIVHKVAIIDRLVSWFNHDSIKDNIEAHMCLISIFRILAHTVTFEYIKRDHKYYMDSVFQTISLKFIENEYDIEVTPELFLETLNFFSLLMENNIISGTSGPMKAFFRWLVIGCVFRKNNFDTELTDMMVRFFTANFALSYPDGCCKEMYHSLYKYLLQLWKLDPSNSLYSWAFYYMFKNQELDAPSDFGWVKEELVPFCLLNIDEIYTDDLHRLLETIATIDVFDELFVLLGEVLVRKGEPDDPKMILSALNHFTLDIRIAEETISTKIYNYICEIDATEQEVVIASLYCFLNYMKTLPFNDTVLEFFYRYTSDVLDVMDGLEHQVMSELNDAIGKNNNVGSTLMETISMNL